jgi:putative oxygen-independent coproporphyrinogen III oxidase
MGKVSKLSGILAAMIPFSLYLHIPFCRHRCGYCDFNTYSGLENLIPTYVEALCREIAFSAGAAQLTHAGAALPGNRLPVHSLFFGGGTPSLLNASQLEQILEAVNSGFELAADVEITLEANPGTLSPGYLKELHSLGVNRLSLGVQSANPQELRLLERQHDFSQVIQSVKWARQGGLDNINLDLIFGLPEQALETWQHTVALALGLAPDHFSLYALTIEHGTPLSHWANKGLVPVPDGDLAADMYEWAAERLDAAGYQQYEISNWGRRVASGEVRACRHNLQYWRNQPYLGFGAGAHGFAAGVRTANVLAPLAYVQRLRDRTGGELQFPYTPATQNAQNIDRESEIGETMMMGLRLTQEGVSRSAFQARFGIDLQAVFDREIQDLISFGLLEWYGEGEGQCLRLTERGRLLGNQVFYRFI